MKKNTLTLIIVIAMVLGILCGHYLHSQISDEAQLKEISGYFSIVTDIFLRLIKMIIAPLVISTLIVGIAHLGESSALGRIGLKTMAWFIAASILSLSLGVIMVQWLQPGAGLNLPLPDLHASADISAKSLDLRTFLTHVFPRSIAEAMVNNEILQIVVFSVFFGSACIALGEKAKIVVDFAEGVSEIMLKVTGYVMLSAPLAVFAAIAATVATKGLEILVTYGVFILGFYASLGVLWLCLGIAAFLVFGSRIFRLFGLIREPILLAFSTASSEAAYPKTLQQIQNFGVSRRISSFVLPLGYSFNLDGSMMYCTFATLFIAQAYSIHLSAGDIVSMLLLLMVTSKGMAGVPRASLVVIAATLGYFGIPEAGLLLVLGVDQFLDMGRSATNVVGNSIAASVVGKWEGEWDPNAANHEPARQAETPPLSAADSKSEA